MEKQYDILIVGIQPWDIEIGSNCKNMAVEFAKHHRVLYINSALDRNTALKQKDAPGVQKRLEVIQGKRKGLVQIQKNLWEYTPDCMIESIHWLPTALFRLANRVNNVRFARSIRKAIQELNFKSFILFNDSDMFRSFHLKELLKPIASVYYTRDNLMTVPYWKKHGETMEKELIQKSDLVVGNSPYLIQEAKKSNAKSIFIGQGCDITMYQSFTQLHKPADLEKLTGKIIGYTGLLSSRRLDIHLIEHVATHNPEWNIVLIGPEENCFKTSNLHNLQNVHFLGNKSPEELPSYVQHFDVCFNPQVINELTVANYPRKIDEYLAVGKPVVATDTPTMHLFEKQVFLAANEEDFNSKIAKALEDNSQQSIRNRKEIAESHTWENCIANFWSAFQMNIKHI